MRTVKVHTNDLLTVVKANREKHRVTFEKAFDGYRTEAMAALTDNLERLKRGDRQLTLFFERPPEDHTKDYDRLIRMLLMSVETIVELDERTFAQYVEDDWDWKESWIAANTKYLNA